MIIDNISDLSLIHLFRQKGIKLVTSDHRLSTAKSAFFAIKGRNNDGNDYIGKAISSGAEIIITSVKIDKNTHQEDVIYLVVEDVRRVLSLVSKEIYPKQPQYTVAVTGTNGKTSVTYLYAQICAYLGAKSAIIGTLGTILFTYNSKTDGLIIRKYHQRDINNSLPTLTTPSSTDIYKTLNDLRQEGYETVALEASSHGLDQKRIEHLALQAAAFTNLTQDHIDYHESMQNYENAKLRLFSDLLSKNKNSTAVINSQDPTSEKISEICKNNEINLIKYGESNADIRLISIHDKCAITLSLFEEIFHIEYQFISIFQIYNLMAALGLAYSSQKWSMKQIIDTIPKLQQPPSRLEYICSHNNAKIYVDYAHTPDAIEKILSDINLKKDLSEFRKNGYQSRIYILFGCGGDRDDKKRPLMGQIAASLADFIIITDDNPRNEDSGKIRKRIIEGIQTVRKDGFIEIADRKKAILYAINNIRSGDILLVVGKGEERFQIIGDCAIPFSDKDCIMGIIEDARKADV